MIGDSDVDVLTAQRCGANFLGCTFGLPPPHSPLPNPSTPSTTPPSGQQPSASRQMQKLRAKGTVHHSLARSPRLMSRQVLRAESPIHAYFFQAPTSRRTTINSPT